MQRKPMTLDFETLQEQMLIFSSLKKVNVKHMMGPQEWNGHEENEMQTHRKWV